MAGSTARAINMALRVVGIGEVERDFKRVGSAGEKSFAQVKKATNGAAQEVSEYTARLRRVTAAAKQAFANIPDFNKGSAEEVAANRREFLLAAIDTEKQNMLTGKGEGTQGLLDLANGYQRTGVEAERAGMSIGRAAAIGAAAGATMAALGKFVLDSAEAYRVHEAALNRFNAEISLTGNFTEASAREIEDMAERVVRASLQTEEAALKGAAALATIPGLTRESFEEAMMVSAALADALQTDLVEVVQTYVGPAFKALADKDMKAFYEATEGKLRPSLQKLVIDLAEAGRTADAQRALIDGLRESAGDGPDGLTSVTNRLTDAWENLKIGFSQEFGEPALSFFDQLAAKLDRTIGTTERARATWQGWMAVLTRDWARVDQLVEQQNRAAPNAWLQSSQILARNNNPWIQSGRIMQQNSARNERKIQQALDRRFADPEKPKKKRRSGKSDAEREAERLKREAESAREAADRIAEANDEVVDSYARRLAEISEKVGLEGDALRAVERRHEIEATVRRLNREEIEKEVEARRAAAAAAGQQFDEAAALKDATAAVDAKAEALRKLAERYATAVEEVEDFNRYQQQSKRLLEALKTPMEQFTEELDEIRKLRIGNFIDDDQFDKAMDRMAERLADLRYELDENAQAWQGFGDDVGQTLVDFIMDGGNALDILRELVRMPLQRLLDQQVGNPVADWIDGLTGNNREKNVADARASLPASAEAAQVLLMPAEAAAGSLTQVNVSGMAAAQALAGVSATLGNPVADLAAQSDEAAASLGNLVPVSGQLGSVFAQLLAMAGGGGSGAGGLLSSVLGLAGAAIGGGAGPSAALAGDAAATIAANPGLFASGTDRVPTGKPFWVGENGRELMEKDRAGNLRVYSNQQAHRMADSGPSLPGVQITVNVPERSDPRRTQSTIMRGAQRGIEMAHRKGLATGGRR